MTLKVDTLRTVNTGIKKEQSFFFFFGSEKKNNKNKTGVVSKNREEIVDTEASDSTRGSTPLTQHKLYMSSEAAKSFVGL